MATRRNRRTRAGKEQTTERLLALSQIALESTAQGVCAYNADSRVVLFNARYLALFNMSSDVIRPGLTYRDVLEHSASRGNFAPAAAEQLVCETALWSRQERPSNEATIAILHQLPALGISVRMDDFRVGYSSLGYLRKFPFDNIKIDRCFIGALGDNNESAATVRTIATLGSNLGVETTAEGIETAAQLALVREAGCTAAQGFYYFTPRVRRPTCSRSWRR
jgi:EAL domain-containing protein (putative c-di-GMP-specific phosphodiesterase class I)